MTDLLSVCLKLSQQLKNQPLKRFRTWTPRIFFLSIVLITGQTALNARGSAGDMADFLPQQTEKEYKGRLISVDSTPLTGIIITNLRSSRSAVSSADGNFTISANPGDRLRFSGAGFQTQEQTVGNETQLLYIIDEEQDLNVIGMPVRKTVERIYTNDPQHLSVASSDVVYNPQITRTPVTSFTNTLAGRLAGLYTVQAAGLPGGDGASLSLRGQQPVILIDGVVASLSTFDLEEIESVTVLKDALATAMLGSRGARGAILVTTKKGKQGTQQISFTAQSAIQKPMGFPGTLRAYDYARLRNEALRNDGIDSLNSGLYYSQAALDAYRTGSNPFAYPDNDYREQLTKNSSTFKRYTVSASGGNRYARYFVSLEHANQSGFFRTVDSNSYNTNNSFKSYVIRSNIDVNITPKLTGGIYLLGRIMNSNEPGVTTGTVLANMLLTPANAYPLLNENHSFGGSQLFQDNMLAQTINSGYRQRYFRDILVNAYLKRSLDEVTPGLYIKLKAAYNSTLGEDINRSKSFAVFQQAQAGYTQFGLNGAQGNSNGIAYQGRTDYEELSIGYDRTFDGVHGISAVVLANRDNNINGDVLPYTITGTSGRVAYNYKGRYMAEVAFGMNGSNRYPPAGKTKRGFFPSIGLGWNIEQEDFMKNSAVFNRLKLYASYGKVGWDAPGYFIYYPRFFDGPAAYFGTGAGSVTTISEWTLPNAGITFEKSNKLNIGLSGSVLNDHLSFTLEYFNNKYYDLLMPRGGNSTTIGNDYPLENIGENRYSGYDATATWRGSVGKVQYFLSANASRVKSEVIYMDEVYRQYDWMKQTGQPVDQLMGYRSLGLFQSQAEINSSATLQGYTPQPGDIKYADLNGDGIINQFDRTAIGRARPLFYYGISFGVSWNGFDLSALGQGAENRDIYLGGLAYWAFQNNGTGQAYSHNLDRWTASNPNATYPRLSYGANINNDASSSFWIKSGDYFRLKNVEIGYTFPVSLVGKIGLKTVRVFANGYNVFTKASKTIGDRDPESFVGAYPLQKLYNFGINIKF
jgi:TonB-linked SusC/RagA family outer membrane protein